MKLTKREVMLLFLLGTVAIVFIGVNYLIMPLYNSNKELKDTLSGLNDQLLTLETGQKITDSIGGQIEKEMETTEALSAPFNKSIRPEQISYWLNSLLKNNNMTMYSIEFTDVVSAVPNYDTDRILPPEGTLDLPIQRAADMVNGVNTGMADPSATDAADPSSAQPAADTAPDAAAADAAAGEQAAVPPETYCTQTILNATGSYADIEKFMSALYAGGRSLTVDSLTITDFEGGGKMAVVAIRFFGVPLPDDVQAESYSFPAPAGQGALMQENAAPEPEPTESETP